MTVQPRVSLPRALWILARPRLLPYVVLLPMAGYGFAHWDRALTPVGSWEIWVVMLAWGLLHAGTLWLNAAVDQDEGEVLMGESIPVPDGIEKWGYLVLIGTVVLAAWADPIAGVAGAVCAVLAVAYSHPSTMWKGHPLLGPLTNGLGYGLLSPLAGWAVVDVSPNPRTAVIWVMGAVGIVGCYFAAQAFQEKEDAERGYRTLVVTHGARGAVLAGRICLGIGLVGSIALGLAGWVPRVCLVAVPLGIWVDRWFAAWLEEPDGGSEAWARGLANRLLISGLVVLGLLLGVYYDQAAHQMPVAGLGTAAGHPVDRPLLGPYEMRRWEAQQRRQARRAVPLGPDVARPR